MKKLSFYHVAALAGLALCVMGLHAIGIDVLALAGSHSEFLISAGALGLIGEVKSLDDLKPALKEFAEAATKKIDAAVLRVKTLEEARQGDVKHIEACQNEIGELASKSFGTLAGGGSTKKLEESVGELVVKDASLDALRSGQVKTVRIAMKGQTFSQKAAIVSTPALVQAYRDPEIFGPLAGRVSVRDLLVVRETTAPSVEFLRATRTGKAAIQAVEGDAKAELGLGFTKHTAEVQTIAAWVPASKQVLSDVVSLKDYIDLELRDALQLEEDFQLLKGPGTDITVSGLWTNAVPYDRAVVGDRPADTLRRAITQVQLARGTPTGIVINPVGLEALELQADEEGRYLVTYTVTDSNGRTVAWRVPVVVTDALDEDEFLVGDFSRAARLYDRQQVTVEVSTSHADFFTRNLVAILAEERVALTVNRPQMLVKGEFTVVVE